MKKMRMLAMLLCLLLTLCACGQPTHNPLSEDFTPVKPVGEVPAEFEDIVAENRFGDVWQYSCMLVRNSDSQLEFVDMTGMNISVHPLQTNRNLMMRWDALCTTGDGGVIYALGFNDTYDHETKSWASEAGVVSKIVKLDAEGNEQWRTELEGVSGASLQRCIETVDGYCFFGQRETPETKRLGVGSPTDLSVIKLDKQGKLLFRKAFGGSDYDTFYRVEERENGFALYARSQSNDGLFEGMLPEGQVSACWRVLLNEVCDVTGLESISYEQLGRLTAYGFTDEQTAREWAQLEEQNAAGSVKLVLDYGDFTLIVSENNIGIKDGPATMSMRLYETETVYSAWRDGRLLWRAAHDNR